MSNLINKNEYPIFTLCVFLIVTFLSIYFLMVSGNALSIFRGYKIPLSHGLIVFIPVLISFFLGRYMKKYGLKTGMKMFNFFCLVETIILVYYLSIFFDNKVIMHENNIVDTARHSIYGIIELIKFNMFYFVCIAPVLLIGFHIIFIGFSFVFIDSTVSRERKRVTGDDSRKN